MYDFLLMAAAFMAAFYILKWIFIFGVSVSSGFYGCYKRKENNIFFFMDYKEEYTYYVVYTIDKKLYERQLAQAMDDIQDNDDQTQFLKEVLSDKLMSSIIVSNRGGDDDKGSSYVFTLDDDSWYDYYDAK